MTVLFVTFAELRFPEFRPARAADVTFFGKTPSSRLFMRAHGRAYHSIDCQGLSGLRGAVKRKRGGGLERLCVS